MSSTDPRSTSAVLHEFCAALLYAISQELNMPLNPSSADSTYSYTTSRVDPDTRASLQRRHPATAPCPACGSTHPRAGFCCDSCHKSYMAEQHRRWDMPGTALECPDWPRQLPARDRADIGASPQSRLGRSDPCWHTDEQVGSWSRCVRTLEEATA